MNRTTALAALATALAACSTNYTPRSPGRVFVTMDGGQPAYVRDGQSHRHGFLGSGLKRAVRGNIAAEAAADEYHDRLRDGLLVMLLGGTCATTAFVWGIADVAGDRDDDRAATKMLVALGCTVLMMGGSFYTLSAEPYRWDAVNIFNDSAPPIYPGYGPPPPAYGPGYPYPAGASVAKPANKRLGMRDD